MKGLVLASMLVLAGRATAGVWNLSADWSNSANPIGPWRLMKNPTSDFTTNWAEWIPGMAQPAWAEALWPTNDHVPVWLRRTAIDYYLMDLPAGAIAVHGAEVDRTGTNVTQVRWTSPITGTVRIWGDIWPARHVGRSMEWALAVNGVATSTGYFASTNAYSSAAPMPFYEGSGGVGATVVAVVPGTTIDLKVISGDPNVGDFLGIRYCISTGDPAALFLDVLLEDWLGPIDQEPVTITILGADGGVVQEQQAFLNSEGPTGILACLAGTYTVCVKGTHWLRKCTSVTFEEGGSSTIQLSLPNGDIDGSNMIDSDDFDQLVANFGGTSGPADIDGSGSIDSDDFDILVRNFGLQGD